MARPKPGVEVMVRNAFELLLEIRAHPQAHRLLLLAIGFLKTLIQKRDGEAVPVVMAVQAVRLWGAKYRDAGSSDLGKD
jgi:hypothetical protein